MCQPIQTAVGSPSRSTRTFTDTVAEFLQSLHSPFNSSRPTPMNYDPPPMDGWVTIVPCGSREAAVWGFPVPVRRPGYHP